MKGLLMESAVASQRRLKIRSVPAMGPAGAVPIGPAEDGLRRKVSQVADCGRLRGASIHRAK